MQTIEEEYVRNIKFENLIKFLSSEELPITEGDDELEFVSNVFTPNDEYILLIKTIIYPLKRKYRGILSSLLGVNKIRLEYNIKYDEDTALITIKNPKFLCKYIRFNADFYVQSDGENIIVKKKVIYENLIPSFITSFSGNVEDDFLEQMDCLTEDMFKKC